MKKQLVFVFLLVSWFCSVQAAAMSEADSMLIQAVQDNNIDQARQALRLGANSNAQDKFGRTPLHFAAKYNAKNVAAMLLEAGANKDVQSICGFTPLHCAAKHNAKGVAEMFLNAGVEISDNFNEKEIRWLDDIIKKINKERERRGVLLFFLQGKKEQYEKKNIEVSDLLKNLLGSDMEKFSIESLPLVSEVYAQRAAAAKTLKKTGRGILSRKNLRQQHQQKQEKEKQEKEKRDEQYLWESYPGQHSYALGTRREAGL